MKKFILVLLALGSVSSFASGVGSTTDFQMTVILGYGNAKVCKSIDAKDTLIKFACEFGIVLKEAGLTEEQLEGTLEKLPQYDSVCAEVGAFDRIGQQIAENLSKVLSDEDGLEVLSQMPDPDKVCR